MACRTDRTQRRPHLSKTPRTRGQGSPSRQRATTRRRGSRVPLCLPPPVTERPETSKKTRKEVESRGVEGAQGRMEPVPRLARWKSAVPSCLVGHKAMFPVHLDHFSLHVCSQGSSIHLLQGSSQRRFKGSRVSLNTSPLAPSCPDSERATTWDAKHLRPNATQPHDWG